MPYISRARRAASVFVVTSFVLVLTLTSCSAPIGGGAGGGGGATTLSLSTGFLTFDGTKRATLSVVADGVWEAEASAGSWLTISPNRGTGSATVVVSVDRTGLAPGAYAGGLLFRGVEPLAQVVVAMRFPEVSGTVASAGGTSADAPVRATREEVSAGAVARLETLVAGRDYVRDEVVVALDETMLRALDEGPGLLGTAALASEATGRAVRAVAGDHGLRVARTIEAPAPLAVLSTQGTSVAETVAALARDGRVRHVEPNYLYELSHVPTDPHYDAQAWHYGMVGLPSAWDLTQGEEDVVVAVIDGGFDADHPDLMENFVAGYDFADRDSVFDASGTVCEEHGTHVAGTVAAVGGNGLGGVGVAPGVRVLPLKVGSVEAGVCRPALDAILGAIYYAAWLRSADGAWLDGPVDVINLSLGSPTASLLEEEAVARALGQGVTVVAAAGNDARGPVNYPAAHMSVIGVGAVAGAETLADYSNIGERLDFVAPGGIAELGVFSTMAGGGFGRMAGTSMATPHVAGVVALMRSANRGLTPAEIFEILAFTATDLGMSGHDAEFGYGLVDAFAAVALARDIVSAYTSDVVVRLEDDSGRIVAETRADGSGAFAFGGVEAGSYTLAAGTDVDRDGVLGEGGEFYAEMAVVIDYGVGDLAVDLALDVR